MFFGIIALMPLTDEPFPSSPGLCRLDNAARRVGVSPRVLAEACQSGRIPVAFVQLGPRSRFVHTHQFDNWLKSLGDSPNNLF